MAQAAPVAAATLRTLFSRPCYFPFLFSTKSPPHLLTSSSPFSSALRRRRSNNALRPPSTLSPEEDSSAEGNESESLRKSRNELKREARRSVKWGMQLAKFNPAQIKRVLKVAALEEDVFDALMLVKRLGPDVREGKRRQFNYIGRLLREAQPELMEALIQAVKNGDSSRLHALSGGTSISIEEEEEEEDISYEDEDEDDESENHFEVAARWFDGLVYKDQNITNEVYSVHNVEFDRQELRKLVRQVQKVQEGLPNEESVTENDSTLTRAKKPLIRFLRSLAKQSLAE